jgi:hypothetical protein
MGALWALWMQVQFSSTEFSYISIAYSKNGDNRVFTLNILRKLSVSVDLICLYDRYMKRQLKLLCLIVCVSFFGSSAAQADPVVILGVTGGQAIDSGDTDFVLGTPSGTVFVFEEITPANADSTQPSFINRATNIFWNVLPIDNSNPIDLTAPTTTVWVAAPNINTTFGAWIQDYIQGYGVAGFNYSNRATYRALGLNSPAGMDFFDNPSSVDLSFGGETYRALVIGVNAILLQFAVGPDPTPIILPEFSFYSSDEKDSRVRISRESDKLICSAGKYRYGMQNDWIDAPLNSVVYSLFLDGKLITAEEGDGNTHNFYISQLGDSKGLVTCSLTITYSGAGLKDYSDWNSNILRVAQNVKSLSISESTRENSFLLTSRLIELDKARDVIRQNHKIERERRNLEYWRLNAQLKLEFEGGAITSHEFISKIRDINKVTLRKINDSRLLKVKDLELNSLASDAVIHEMEIALEKALEDIETTYALTLEEAGFAIAIK